MRSRKKPGAYAGTGERPISIQGEARLDKAIAEATEEREQRIRILEQENARLQVQVAQTQEEVDEEITRLKQELKKLKKKNNDPT